jgi:hypothetical protein
MMAEGMTTSLPVASQTDFFAGRRILLIAAQYFGYDAAIAGRLRALGASVTQYDDRPSTTTLYRILIRLHPMLAAPRTWRYVNSIVSAHRSDSFDDILVIKGQGFTVPMMRRILDAFPGARKIFYNWDSFRNARGSREKLPLFQRRFTFDPGDARDTSEIKFRQSFFSDEYRAQAPADAGTEGSSIDVLFVGTIHTDRYAVLKRLRRALPPGISHYYYLYFPSRLIYLARRVFDPHFWRARARDFKFQPLGRDDTAALFRRARVVVDIERPVQTGLTMRTLEALASGKKVATTNSRITQYDFFDAANIAVIDRKSPSLSESFLRQPARPVPPEFLRRYSLDQWLLDVLGPD